MSHNTSVSLGDYYEGFVAEKISTGRFNNASELIRAGLRLLEEEENRIAVLKAAVEEGIKSGLNMDFNPKTHLQKLKKNRYKNG